jgi:hypothetical protein
LDDIAGGCPLVKVTMKPTRSKDGVWWPEEEWKMRPLREEMVMSIGSSWPPACRFM